MFKKQLGQKNAKTHCVSVRGVNIYCMEQLYWPNKDVNQAQTNLEKQQIEQENELE